MVTGVSWRIWYPLPSALTHPLLAQESEKLEEETELRVSLQKGPCFLSVLKFPVNPLWAVLRENIKIGNLRNVIQP